MQKDTAVPPVFPKAPSRLRLTGTNLQEAGPCFLVASEHLAWGWDPFQLLSPPEPHSGGGGQAGGRLSTCHGGGQCQDLAGALLATRLPD